MRIVGITGGIGAGKSVVSRICRLKGFPVYDCDAEAHRLSKESSYIKEHLVEYFGEQVLINGEVNRPFLAQLIFSDEKCRHKVNALIHAEVKNDIRKWSLIHTPLCFVESAILFSSGLSDLMDRIWIVKAPKDTCIRRVMSRNNVDQYYVEQRMSSQECEIEKSGYSVEYIENDGQSSLIARINELIKKL